MTNNIIETLNTAPLLGANLPTVLSSMSQQQAVQIPTCTCHTFIQFYLCGCPDRGIGPQGQAIPSVYYCPAFYLPVVEQCILATLGFTHRVPHQQDAAAAALPHDDTPRFLPFPCYAHMQHAQIKISPAELQQNTYAVLAQRHAAYQAREREREREAIRAQASARARSQSPYPLVATAAATAAQQQEETETASSSSLSGCCFSSFSSSSDEEDWPRSESCVDLYTLDNERNPWGTRYEQAKHAGYITDGAWRVDWNALNQARWQRFGAIKESVEKHAIHAGNHPDYLHM